jgi:CTP synthase
MVKFVVVTGGVLSGIGKGIIASSTGLLLKVSGFRVTAIKIDPYINIDAGTMSPFEHGEVFVLDDGGEVDLDLGNYERFVDITTTRDHNITTGKIYHNVIEKERRGDYLGQTVQVIPHICNEIQNWIERVAKIPTDGSKNEPDICVIEMGGTVGDIESMPFIEAMRQFQFRVGRDNICFMHVSLVPVLGSVGEQKTKPTQHSVRELRALGINPDMIICRSGQPLTLNTKQKISSFCHVSVENVLAVHDVSNIYKVPLLLLEQGLISNILAKLQLTAPWSEPRLETWKQMAMTVDRVMNQTDSVRIAIVGKYTGLPDAYISVIRALQHAAYFIETKVQIDWVEASSLEPQRKGLEPDKYDESWKILSEVQGILVPGGFGDRGIEGKILAANYARTKQIPYLGICLGLQIATIEYARNVLNWTDANSEEFDKHTTHPVVIYMPEISKVYLGGTMRLGSRRTVFKNKMCLAAMLYSGIYGEDLDYVDERHRHRYEVNPKYVPELERTGLAFVGQDAESGQRQEILEIPTHPFFLAVQYHPEFKGRPTRPSPPFVGLMLAASGLLSAWIQDFKASPPFKKNKSLDDTVLANAPSNRLDQNTGSLSSVPTYPLTLSSGSIPNLRASTGSSPSSSLTSTPEKNIQKSPPLQHDVLKNFEY